MRPVSERLSFQITYIFKNYINLLLIASKIIATPPHTAECTNFSVNS